MKGKTSKGPLWLHATIGACAYSFLYPFSFKINPNNGVRILTAGTGRVKLFGVIIITKRIGRRSKNLENNKKIPTGV